MRAIDLTGERFGRLRVLSRGEGRAGRPTWLCRCDCGNHVEVASGNLRSGNSRSCGCARSESLCAINTKHGMARTTEYRVWAGMMSRCTNKNSAAYPDYGGRGIVVCSEWQEFLNFYQDMGPRPSHEHTLERLDNNGPYSKDNCSWELHAVQMNNTRKNVFIEHNGKVQTVAQWCRELGINYTTVQRRLRAGWAPATALTTPAGPYVYRRY